MEVGQPRRQVSAALRWSTMVLQGMPALLVVSLVGALLMVLLYQLPASHAVDVGGYDAAYVQGFHDAEVARPSVAAPAYLQGSDGSVRWSRAQSFLRLPQAGLPASLRLRLRGWRTEQPPPQLTVLLNGREVLGTIQTSGAWEEHSFAINTGLLKPGDMFVELRAETTVLPGDDRAVGVLLDQVLYQVQPGSHGWIVPHPPQVAYGALAAALFWLVARPGTPRRQAYLRLFVFYALLAPGFVLFYRLQPPLYPYPLRGLLPLINLVLAAILLVRYGPGLLARYPAAVDGIAALGVSLWTGAMLLAARAHLTLSVPGVEKDFRVFATRTEHLAEVFRADGFYNLGYPLLLWLVRPLAADNVFLAARWVAAISGAVLLLSTYWLARALLCQELPARSCRAAALLALLMVALSPLVVQYALYVGSDMPFAALTTLSLALLLSARSLHWPADAGTPHVAWVVWLAGVVAGGAFLVRHPGLLLLPWGLLCCFLVLWMDNRQPQTVHDHRLWRLAVRRWAPFALGFLLAALPQLLVNTLQTGQPLFNQQAKNVWLAVYAGIDWGRWHEVPDSIGLREIILRDPLRFLGNWWNNLLAYLGSGAEDTGESGRAIQLRLLAWPANWLAVIGVLIWGYQALRAWRQPAAQRAAHGLHLALTGFIGLYVLAISTAFVLPRFFLPLAPIYAAAAAWLLWRMLAYDAQHQPGIRPAALVATLILLLLLWGGFGTGTRYVLSHQPADEVALIRLTLATLQPGEQVVAALPADVSLAKYSTLAHRVVPWPTAADPQTALARAQARGADYLLWDATNGPPPLPDPGAARIGGTERYGLYRLAPP